MRTERHWRWFFAGRSHRRYYDIKRLFELRRLQLDDARQHGWPPTPEESNAYGRAVVKYTRAHQKWRWIRGWF